MHYFLIQPNDVYQAYNLVFSEVNWETEWSINKVD